MQNDVFLADCPARTALELISHRWSVVVLHGLGLAPMRFGELERRIGGIGPKALAESLTRLGDAGLVEQGEDRSYRLTGLGTTLLEPIQTLAGWAEDNAEAILTARESPPAALR